MILTCMLLALSTSIDSIGIGLTYGIRDITISRQSKIILFIISLIISSISILIGNTLNNILSEEITNIIGSLILFFIGLIIIVQTLKREKRQEKKVYKLFIKFLGITIQIIKDPISSDFDNSKKIDSKEAIYLGTALSLDSFSVGIGAGMLGSISIIFPLIVSLFQIIFLSLGRNIGEKLNKKIHIPSKIWSILSAVLLILIGIVRLV